MTHIQMCGYFIHCYAAIFLHDGFNCCNGLTCHYSCTRPGRGQSVTELMPFMNFLVHSYTYCSDRHASPYWTSFVDEFLWVSSLHYLKNGWQNAVLLVYVESGAAIFTLLLRRRVAFLHRTATCRPLFKPWVSLLSTYKTSRCVSNFYRTFKFFIWLSLVHSTETSGINFRVRGLLIHEHSCHLCRD